jgi:hypothetical protein
MSMDGSPMECIVGHFKRNGKVNVDEAAAMTLKITIINYYWMNVVRCCFLAITQFTRLTETNFILDFLFTCHHHRLLLSQNRKERPSITS